MTPFERALAFIVEKGAAIRQADMDTLEALTMEFPQEDFAELCAVIDEKLALIVNDPGYKGDIPSID